MVRLPKIKIGVQTRKNHFDLSHDVNTTSDFGFCQPTIIRHLNAGSSSKLNTSIGVRLAPLPCPTFGRIKLKTYNCLVPIQEVYEAFDYMQKKTSVASAFGSYIPTKAPSMTAYDIWNSIVGISLKNWCEMFNYTVGDDYGKLKVDHDENIFMNFSLCAPSFLWSNWEKGNEYVSDVDGKKHARYYPIDGTLVPIGSYISDRGGIYDESGSDDYWFRGLYNGFLKDLADENVILEDDFSLDLGGKLYKIPVNFEESGLFQARMNGPYIAETAFSNFATKELFIDALTGIQDYKLDAVRKAYYVNRSNFNDADFVFGNSLVKFSISPSQYGGEEGVDPVIDIEVPYALCGNWTKRGQRLFKVINAIGLRGFVYNDNVDLCKLFAYYKAWFDIMNPGRSIQWKETSAYRLIHSYYDLNEDIISLLDYDEMPYHGAEVFADWEQFLVDVSNCCYVLPVDNITAATPLPIEQVGSMGDAINLPTNRVGTGNHIYAGNTELVYPFMNETDEMDGLAVQALLKLYKLANKNSVIGSRIEDYLRTKFGYTIEHSNILQGSEQTVKIEEIFANAGTSENYLGEIGGRGSTNNAYTSSIKFDADKFSIFVQFVCIVPFGDYVQGNVKAKLYRNDFYQEVYDSLGKEALSMSEILARSNDITYRPAKQSYGFVPMCWRDKVQNSMHNGGFALKSQRDTLLPYSLDRLFNEHVKRAKSAYRGLSSHVTVDFIEDAPSVITPSEEMRYIGRTPDYGSYDRIFFDNTGYFDNFILHVVEDWDYYANMKPISESFDTFDDDNDDSTKTITAS